MRVQVVLVPGLATGKTGANTRMPHAAESEPLPGVAASLPYAAASVAVAVDAAESASEACGRVHPQSDEELGQMDRISPAAAGVKAFGCSFHKQSGPPAGHA